MRKFSILFFMALCVCAFINKATGQTLTENDRSELARMFATDVQLQGDTREIYANYQASRLRTPFLHSQVLTLKENPKANRDVAKILVIVTSEMFEPLSAKITRYANDIHQVYGCEVIMETVTGGNYMDIKNLILDHQENLDGAVLIGDIDVAWYEMEDDFDEYGYAVWPCDLYFMDLDGEWMDTDGNDIFDMHIGDIKPEIFVGRISTANMGTLWSEVTGLEHYLDKNHNFWIGVTQVNQKFGLTYTDHDWAMYSDFKTDIRHVYGNSNYDKIAYGEDACFGRQDYISRLQNDRYEFIHLSCHASHEYLQMSGGGFYSNTIFNIPNEAIGYNLFCCSACNWTEVSPNSYRGFLGGVHAYNPNNSALVAVGSTKTGSMLSFNKFYIPLGQGKSIGEALKLWWITTYGNTHQKDIISWHYGMSIIGDPMVNFLYNANTAWEIGFPTPADVTATFTKGALTISGTGAMMDWESEADVPWKDVADHITNIIIPNEVTTIGEWAFAGCSSLTDVTVYWEIPPVAPATAFPPLLLPHIDLHVLQCTEYAYVAAPVWQDFNLVMLPFNITPSIESNGSIWPSTVQTVNCGDDITFTAIPDDYYEVDYWSINDAVTQTGGDSYTISDVREDATINVVFKSLIKIDEKSNQTIQIYPNPTTGVLNLIQEIIENGEWKIENVEVFDIYGRKMSQISYPQSHILNIIDISELSAGIYFVRITTDKGTVMKKVVKE